MRLVIRANSLRNERLSQTIVGEFDERGGTIGRSDSNTMTLPDPERHVSRLQAEVTFAGGVFSIRNVGSSNPIIVSSRPISPGEATALRDGDRMTVGGYELQVALVGGAPAARGAAAKPVDARTVIGASAGEGRTHPPRQPSTSDARAVPSAVDPFADLLGAPAPAGAADPFADLLGAPSAPLRAPAATPMAPAAARLPDDFDPFADLAPPAPAKHAASKEVSLSDLVGDRSARPGSLDTVFDLNDPVPGKGDPMDQFLSPAAVAAAPPSADPFAFLEHDRGAGRDGVGPASADHTPELRGAYKPPPVRSAQTDVSFDGPTMPPLAGMPPLPRPDAADALWAAFCDGAQVSLPGQQRLTPELMRLIGATLRQAIEGTVHLSAARTTTKQELHVPVTTIQTKNNNPLKFAPDAASAMAMLLQPPIRGFMAAPEAVQDAMADLLGHTVGTMAGTRAAIEGMLRRFEPAQLEQRLSGGGMLDALLPMNRRAKLWELYLQHYERISEGAREDFHELFGKAFVKAYEEQADRIAAARRTRR
jgi:predicted component of type VI protein secretion system